MARKQAEIAATLILIMAVLLLAIPTGATWEIPEGTPYAPHERVLVAQPRLRSDLSYHDDVLAWAEFPWNETGTAPVYYGLGKIRVALNATSSAPAFHELSTSGVHPVTNGRYLAWIELDATHFQGSAYTSGDPETVRLVDLYTGRQFNWSFSEIAPWTYLHMDAHSLVWPLAYSFRLVDLDDEAPSPVEVQALPCEIYPWVTGRWIVFDHAASGDGTCPDGRGITAWNRNTKERWNFRAEWTRDVDGGRVLGEIRNESRDDSLFLIDLDHHIEHRLTFSPGSKYDTDLSGDWVTWVDIRHRGSRERHTQDQWDLYFLNVWTRNEYKLQGDFRPGGSVALYQGHVAYTATDGSLRIADLPTAVLVATPNITPTPSGAVQVDLGTNTSTTTAWDRDGDGVFETNGPLIIQAAADAGDVLGRAVDAAGRMAVRGVTALEMLQGFQIQSIANPPSVPATPPIPLTIGLLLAGVYAFRKQRR